MTLDLKAVEALEEMMSILKMTRASTEWLETQDRYEEALDKAAPELLALAKEALAAREWLAERDRYFKADVAGAPVSAIIAFEKKASDARNAYRALVSQHQSGGGG